PVTAPFRLLKSPPLSFARRVPSAAPATTPPPPPAASPIQIPRLLLANDTRETPACGTVCSPFLSRTVRPAASKRTNSPLRLPLLARRSIFCPVRSEARFCHEV